MCFEPSHANGLQSHSSYRIGQILYVDQDNIYLYKLKSDGVHSYTCKSSDAWNMWQELLTWAYDSQSNYNIADNLAGYLRSDTTWKTETEEALNGEKITFNTYNKNKYETYFRNDNDHKYAGVFVFFSASWGGTESEHPQGTMAYRVVRENAVPKHKLVIEKRDELTNSALNGVKFEIELKNVKSIKGRQILSNPATLEETTENGGKITLEEIEPIDVNKDIVINIKEIAVPTVDGGEYHYIVKGDCGQVTFSGKESQEQTKTITVTNKPYIELGGTVWLDKPHGEKENPEPPDGKMNDDEEGIDGVLVQLYDIRNKNIKATATTKNGGKYKFDNIEKTKEGYYILFNYDGINYQETKALGSKGTDSKAVEQNRTVFNERFKTIEKGKSNDGTKLAYDNNDGVSTLQVNMDGSNPADQKKQLRMTAKTGTYFNTSKDIIDCGLVKKEVDLSLGTDVKSAKVKINGKETEYSYGQIMDGALDFQDKSSEKDKDNIIYNLNLYKSDYNYRIEDYDKRTETIKQNEEDAGKINEETKKETKKESELEVYVTYNVALKNQTPASEATVNEFVYYYDGIYKPHQIDGVDIVDGETKYTGKTYNFEIKPEKITFTSNGEGLKLTDRTDIELTFVLNKDSAKYKDLEGKVYGVKNVAEITKYSTTKGGLIDKDSEPGNADVAKKDGTWSIGHYEDDSDEAKALNISVDNRARKITGTVFDDTSDKDGKLNNENTKVNDVIVQLIEVKKIGDNYYEYIWQQTKSGSEFVEKLSEDGKEITKHKYDKAEGYYEFTGFIPANYIIRYIYGDGTTYEITDNVKTYNGQDYKSTIDNKYKEQWYNTAGYTTGESVARDNEARRLEVMSYSSTIEKDNGLKLERRDKEDLEKTCMCAETSRINIPVDAEDKNEDNKEALKDYTGKMEIKEENKTKVSYGYTKAKETIEFPDMNFGLALRPETKLVLEKHITGLKITPNGTGVQAIIDANANIEDIIKGSNPGTVDGGTVEAKGVTQGLATIKSTRGNRGFWQVATDVEELVQGAELEVEYTYVIRNDSEKDYLNEQLITAYKDNPDKYSEFLNGEKGIVKTVKDNMRKGSYSYKENCTIGNFLGQYYYTGKTATTDKEVLTRVETFEEAVNNSLTFDETSGKDFSKKTVTEEEAMKKIHDAEGNDKDEKINTIITNNETSEFLTGKTGDNYNDNENTTADWSKKVTLKTVLSSSGGEIGTNLPSYIAEITKYSNAAGRRDMNAEPANLSYVHSDDTRETMKDTNQRDEFWGETIIVTKPTGADKLTPIQITLIAIGATALVGVGIILIRKFVLKK